MVGDGTDGCTCVDEGGEFMYIELEGDAGGSP